MLVRLGGYFFFADKQSPASPISTKQNEQSSPNVTCMASPPFAGANTPFISKEGQTAYRIGSTRQNYTGCRFIWQVMRILLQTKRPPMRVRLSPFDIGRNHGPYNHSRTEQAAVARLLGDAGYAALPSTEKSPAICGAFLLFMGKYPLNIDSIL